MVLDQAYLFLIFTINGMIIGLLFDFFRIIRRTFKTNDILTYIEDILFWILTGLILLYSIFVFNNGELRLFMIFSVILGVSLYLIIFSKYIIKINITILKFIKNILSKIINILIVPFKYIYNMIKKVFFRPITFSIINIRKISTNLLKNNVKK